MKKIFLFIFSILFISCEKNTNETITSSYIPPLSLPVVLKYEFSRNGYSSVDVLECSLVKEPLDRLYSIRLVGAQITNEREYNDAFNLFNNGLYGVKPKDEIASSPLHLPNKEKITQDIENLINTTATISGYYSDSSVKRRAARAGQTGFVGINISDPNRAYVNEKGLAVADVFQYSIMGAIYLDKILNYHLDEYFFDNQELIEKHQNVTLPAGRNYTELEHHWDLAYGYYDFWKNLAQPEGIPLLKESEKKIFNAFVQGRLELGRYRYEDMKTQIRIIREELSKVAVARAMNFLLSENTLANLEEGSGSDAFATISKGYGLIYALQFARKANGETYFSYNEIKNILAKMQQGQGFWDKNKLLADENTDGSLKNIAKTIAQPFQISINDIKR
ncbi:MAG: DUF4856 domain-containing protein [Capnocytophaga sp.]|nr:DUF4856 domain-containing protein [Capnocytophaga sp.]